MKLDSRIVTEAAFTRKRSPLAVELLMLAGMVAKGRSDAHQDGIYIASTDMPGNIENFLVVHINIDRM